MTGFGPEHLPYGVFRRAGESPRVGARLGDGVLDLARATPMFEWLGDEGTVFSY